MAWWWYISAVNNKKYEKLVAVVKSWRTLVQSESKLCWDTTFDQDLSSRLKITLSQTDNFRLYLTWPLYNIWHRWFRLSSVKHTSLASVILRSQGDSPLCPAMALLSRLVPKSLVFLRYSFNDLVTSHPRHAVPGDVIHLWHHLLHMAVKDQKSIFPPYY